MTAPTNPSSPLELLKNGVHSLGIALDLSALEKMIRHLDLLMEWKDLTNLSSIRSVEDAVILHLLDSITVLKILPVGNFKILDVGTGGGFPGLVLALARPELRITLLDRNPKKIVFVKYAGKETGAQNVKFVNTALADLRLQTPFPTYDFVVSRAFSSKSTVLLSLTRYLNPRGGLIMMLGPGAGEQPLELEGSTLENRWDGVLPFSSHQRSVLLYRRKSYSDIN